MGIKDQELIQIFDKIEEKLLEIQNGLSTVSVTNELRKYTDINTFEFLEMYLEHLDSVKKMKSYLNLYTIAKVNIN